MADCRFRWRGRMTGLVLVLVLGAMTIIIQKYVFTSLSRSQAHRNSVRKQVQLLRQEAAVGSHAGPAKSSTLPSTKVVLMLNFPYWYELTSGSRVFSNCNHSCALTQDPQLLQDVDAVVVYTHHFSLTFKSSAQTSASPGQVWVYFAVESPFNSDSVVFGTPTWQHRFNWTMTYRRDSEFYFGYGDFAKQASSHNLSALAARKRKLVAWFVSNCHTQSRREDFVSALKEFVEVDVYGACGNLTCGKEGDQSCMDMLSRDYYFYLSFENSMCRDYITEKLYRTMKRVDIVPVVRGGANYTALLPKGSFIDVSQFPSVKALARYLKKVAGDRKLYQQYLAWKNEWQVIEPITFAFCDLCHRLHHAQRWARVYPNVDTWWHQDSCHDPPPVRKS